MRFDIVTIFPAMVEAYLAEGVVGRAVERGQVEVGVHDLRVHTEDRHRTVDDVPYGGGPGMVMKAEPFLRAVEMVRSRHGAPDRVVLLSPQGTPLTHQGARQLAEQRHLLLLCGRYEAVDERVRDAVVTEEISIGDYVVSGGELPALVVLDAVSRFVPGVVGDADSVDADSFAHGVLDHPHYTRPAEVAGRRVPEVLLSGHHQEIARWRRRQALERTLARRPDLLREAGVELEDDERGWLRAQQRAIQAEKAEAGE